MRCRISRKGRAAMLMLALSAGLSAGYVQATAQEAGGEALPPSVCQTDARHAQFDFWVGDWSVHGPDGRYAGRNDITKEEYGCLIRERWTDARGVTGTSINYFNPATEKWRQVWTSRGFTIDYEGGLDEVGAMALEGEITYLRDGVSKPFRGRWIPREDGSVNQVFHEYDAASGEWKEWFNAVYTPAGQGSEAADPVQHTLPRFSYPSWAGDEGGYLYESNVAGDWDIWMMSGDGLGDSGGALRRLTSSPAAERMPALSPDGRTVAFVSDADGDFEVFTLSIETGETRQLTDNAEPEIHPFWSPDGERIIFNRRVDDRPVYDIFSIRADGTGEMVLLSDGELNSYAQVSPDGRYLVFDKWVGNDETNGEVFVMDMTDRSLTRLTENDDYDGYPAWFPDSRRIVYASDRTGEFKLYTMNIDGTGRQQLTFGPGFDARANVSSDGDKIVFNRLLEGSINIYTLDIPDDSEAEEGAEEG